MPVKETVSMHEKPRHFTDLKVWQKAHHLFLKLIGDVRSLKNFGVERIIVDQIVRSAGSISANVAEGFNAHSTKEYLRYLDISVRSTAETENWLYKIKDLSILSDKACKEKLQDCKEISRMIQGLMNSLKKKMC